MTLAVADGFMSAFNDPENYIEDGDFVNDDNKGIVEESVIRSMKSLGLRYFDAGYGGSFRAWLVSGNGPYNSWGNGSAMRVSSTAWICSSIDQVRELARLQAAVTHDHPEGIKGAEALASAIFIARVGGTKELIKKYVTEEFGYDLDRTCDSIRPGYRFDVSCQGSVPEAIRAFLDGSDFEGVIRTAVSLGGDTDTIGAMAGSIAEAFYGVPDHLKDECEKRLPDDMADILLMFHCDRRVQLLEKAIDAFESDRSQEMLLTILWYLKAALLWVPCNAVLSERDQKLVEKMVEGQEDNLDSLKGESWQPMDDIRLVPDILMNGDEYFFPAFTSCEEMGDYGDGFSKVQKHIMGLINMAKNNEKDIEGIVINAFTKPFVVSKELFSIIEKFDESVVGDK
jgi:hypothetical protein